MLPSSPPGSVTRWSAFPVVHLCVLAALCAIAIAACASETEPTTPEPPPEVSEAPVCDPSAGALTLAGAGPRHLSVRWPSCTDADGPDLRYRVYLDGRRVKEVQGTKTLLTQLAPSTTYQVHVEAWDTERASKDAYFLTTTTRPPWHEKPPEVPRTTAH